ncbi:MAG TPA: OsmC family protein [Steroidobacteraceae bacterium]|nr:OsmC family protein [Steroidobacteraceae bacterium]
MHPYPHIYRVSAAGAPGGTVAVSSAALPTMTTAAPPEFDGPGGFWSPETQLCAAVADCFILTFRAVSRVMRLEWLQLDCRVEGTLERVGALSQFTRFATHATLTVPTGTDVAKARSLLERAEHTCLISNSLHGTRTLETEIVTTQQE